jgi:hypothetical protein
MIAAKVGCENPKKAAMGKLRGGTDRAEASLSDLCTS